MSQQNIQQLLKKYTLLNQEVSVLSTRLKDLRQQVRETEEAISTFLKTNNHTGLRFNGKAVVLEKKSRIVREGKAVRQEKMKDILRKYGVVNPEQITDELTQVRKVEKEIVRLREN